MRRTTIRLKHAWPCRPARLCGRRSHPPQGRARDPPPRENSAFLGFSAHFLPRLARPRETVKTQNAGKRRSRAKAAKLCEQAKTVRTGEPGERGKACTAGVWGVRGAGFPAPPGAAVRSSRPRRRPDPPRLGSGCILPRRISGGSRSSDDRARSCSCAALAHLLRRRGTSPRPSAPIRLLVSAKPPSSSLDRPSGFAAAPVSITPGDKRPWAITSHYRLDPVQGGGCPPPREAAIRLPSRPRNPVPRSGVIDGAGRAPALRSLARPARCLSPVGGGPGPYR